MGSVCCECRVMVAKVFSLQLSLAAIRLTHRVAARDRSNYPQRCLPMRSCAKGSSSTTMDALSSHPTS
uniref:Putative secreted peptide n=1 Tax=Anopheles braziliensis TaxID=58242 RepID=A0A2M3ZVL0_9DIPT